MGQDAADDGGPGRLAEERDVVRVTAERGDVLPHPAQRGDDVEQAAVGRGPGEVEEPGDAEPVVDGDQDDAVTGEGGTVVHGGPCRAGDESSAVDEHHHGQAALRGGGRPHVDGEVVLAAAPAGAEVGGHVDAAEPALGLRRVGAGHGGVPYTVPGLVRLRRREPVGAHGRGGVGDVQEGGGAAVTAQTADGSLRDGHDGFGVVAHLWRLSAGFRAHLALAELLREEPDRRAWHLAAATVRPDQEVSAALQQTADRARRRGGFAAAAAAQERAAELSPRREDRARLLTEAAATAVFTGQLGWVEHLSAEVRECTDDQALLGKAALATGRLMSLGPHHTAAFALLMRVANEGTDAGSPLVLDALAAAAGVRYYSGEESQQRQIQSLVSRVPDDASRAALHAWVRAVSDPSGAGASLAPVLPGLIAEAEGDAQRLTALAIVAWLLDQTTLAARTFDEAFDQWRAHGPLPDGLGCAVGWTRLEQGRWAEARSVAADIAATASAAGLDHAEACAQVLDATVVGLLGDPAAARRLAERALSLVDPLESRSVAVSACRALGMAAVAEGDYDTAYTQFRSAFTDDGDPVHYHVSYTVLAELAAAAVRRGQQEHAAELLERSARRLGTGMSARVSALIERGRALLADPEHAEPFFQAALVQHAGEQWPFERAQTRLDYGEWLRRRRRIAEARPLLGAALETFQRLGARPWIDRAQAELRAAGIEVTAVVPSAFTELSPQQQQIVHLAARGLTNREIGEKLFLSPRTVGSHLYRVFPKLGITARSQLRDVLEGTLSGTSVQS